MFAVLLHGRPVDKIVEQAQRLDPELIILGSHGREALDHLLGSSVCLGVLKKVVCPVVIVWGTMAFPVYSDIQAAAPEISDATT